MRRCYRWLLNASYEAPDPASQNTPPSTSPTPTMPPMISRYCLNARSPWRQLPEPAQTVSGMIRVITKITATVFRKVSITP